LLPPVQPIDEPEELAEMVAWQLLLRWGVVFREVYLRERLALPWRETLWALRRLEARGLTRGGHFVTGVTGEQFANETTIPLLSGRRSARKAPALAGT
jgi:ATP-dependent Lhr-like helicase